MQMTPQRLGKMVEASFGKFDPFRKNRIRFISQYVGRFYRTNGKTDDELGKASPINLLYTAVTTLLPNMVFNAPKVKADTSVLMYRDYADLLGDATSQALKKMRFDHELRMATLDAIFYAGFIKTGLAVGDKVIQIAGQDFNIGEVFAERVDPDDMILDPAARSWDEQAFIGNRFRADLDTLLEVGYGDADLLQKLADSQDITTGGVNRTADIAKQRGLGSEEPRRFVDLVEIFLPAENRIVTLPFSKSMTFDRFISDIPYDGPKSGPYHMLGFAQVPDNLLPVAPAGIWYDLHILGNRIARKLARQADRNKRVLAYEEDAEEDVQQIADSGDGETVRVSDLNKIKEVEFGGASDQSYAWMAWVKQAFSEQAGSIELLAGTGPGAPTATQASMMQANTSVRVNDMQNAVYKFAAEVATDVAFYLHTDPLIEMPLVRRVNGVEQQGFYTPEMRQGDWFDYNISIVPFSMERADPNTAVRRRLEFATNVVPAAANAAILLGPGFNAAAFLTRIARDVGIDDADQWLNLPEMQQWIMMKAMASMSTGDPGKAGGGAGGPKQPNQPVPTATGPAGGMSPEQEMASMQQEPANEGQQSVRSMGILGSV